MKILNENVSRSIINKLNEANFELLNYDGYYDLDDNQEVEAKIVLFFNETAEEQGITEVDAIQSETSKYHLEVLDKRQNQDGSWELTLKGTLSNVLKLCTNGDIWSKRAFISKGYDKEFGLLVKPIDNKLW